MENKEQVEGIPANIYVALESLKIVSRMMRYEEHSTSNLTQKNIDGEFGSKETTERSAHARKIRRLTVPEKVLRDSACQVIGDFLLDFPGSVEGELSDEEV